MKKNLNHKEIESVIGGLDYKKILEGTAIKVGSHYIECLLPEGEKGTFFGEMWNGALKGFSFFGSSVAILVMLSTSNDHLHQG